MRKAGLTWLGKSKELPDAMQQPPGDGDITEAERLFFNRNYLKEK